MWADISKAARCTVSCIAGNPKRLRSLCRRTAIGRRARTPDDRKVVALFSWAFIRFRIGVGSKRKWHFHQAKLNCSAAFMELKSSPVSSMCCVNDFGEDWCSIQHEVDATTCRGIMLRRGAGGIKHLQVQDLWVQEAVRQYNNNVVEIPREQNVADALASPSTPNDLEVKLTTVGVTWPSFLNCCEPMCAQCSQVSNGRGGC